MKLLLKQVTIADKLSQHNNSIKDILIVNGRIESITDTISEEVDQVIDVPQLYVSPGWVDTFSHFNDPGFEFKETLESGAAAAAAGGYTHVFVVPNTKPVIDNKSLVEYIVQKSKSLPVTVYPLGAVSKKIEGKELSEMYDMYNSGAVAFSDGTSAVQDAGLLLKALQYVMAVDATIIQLPVDESIAKWGLMNEGIVSTTLGLPGIPAIGEESIINRDIELVKYTGSKLHITGVSTGKGLQLIKQAKAFGVKVTCSVTPYHLWFSDLDLSDYDTNLKVNPPLRSIEDVEALRNGVLDGTIDCIASHHLPENSDQKICEFEYASYGMITLETTFSVVNDIFPNLPTHSLIDLFSSNARQIFSLPQSVIEAGQPADLTLFQRDQKFTFQESANRSKSKNSPFFEKQLQGRVIGIINKDRLSLNDQKLTHGQ